MKGKLMKVGKLAAMAVVAVLVWAVGAHTQTERRPPVAATIQVGTVNDKSPAVNLNAVGKEITPGVFEVDPGAIRGKRLTLPSGSQSVKFICIGKWKNGECRGIYIEW